MITKETFDLLKPYVDHLKEIEDDGTKVFESGDCNIEIDIKDLDVMMIRLSLTYLDENTKSPLLAKRRFTKVFLDTADKELALGSAIQNDQLLFLLMNAMEEGDLNVTSNSDT